MASRKLVRRASKSKVETRPGRAAPSPLAARRRSEARGLALEAEADLAARRLLGGARGLATSLSPAAPAAPLVTGTAGSPLPADLRQRLEVQFGADLGAVRLHTESAAAQAVRAEGARGVAAGRHVYLDLPTHALGSERGLALLGHEIAHVLQQTRRPGPAGRLRATDQRGSGAVQRKKKVDSTEAEAFLERVAKLAEFEPTPTWAQLRQRWIDSEPLVEPEIGEVEKLIGTAGQPTAGQLRALSTRANSVVGQKVFAGSKAVYVDTFKFLGKNDTALGLLEKAGWRLPTAFRSRDFLIAARARAASWTPAIARTADFARDYYPTALIKTYRDFFFQPLRLWFGERVPDLDRQEGEFQKKFNEHWNQASGAEIKARNELETTALIALFDLDVERKLGLEKALDQDARSRASAVTIRRSIASQHTGDPPRSLVQVPEMAALAAAIWPDVAAVARQAMVYWDAVIARATAAGGDPSKRDAPTQTTIDALRADKKLQAALAAVARQVLTEEPPAPDAYVKKVEAARKDLRKASKEREETLVKSAAAGATQTEETVTAGVALLLLARAETGLRRYDRSRDDALMKDKQNADERVGSQILVATSLRTMAETFGLAELRKEVETRFDPRKPRLALLGEWVQKTDVEWWRFSAGPGGTFASIGLSHRKLEELMLAAYRGKLVRELGEASFKVDRAGNDLVTAVALEAASKFSLPQKWVMARWEIWPGQGLTSSQWRDLFWNHPRVQAKVAERRDALRSQEGESFAFSAGDPPGDGMSLHLWILPGMEGWVKTLRARVPALDGLVVAILKKKKRSDEYQGMPWYDWLQWLGMAAEELSEAELKKVKPAVEGAVAAEIESARLDLAIAGRQASTIDRGFFVLHMRTLLALSDRLDFDRPLEIFSALRTFTSSVIPGADRVLQTTALLLEIAPELVAFMGPFVTRWGNSDVVGPLAPLVSGSLATWRSHEKALFDPSILGETDRKALETGALHLRGLERDVLERVRQHQERYVLHGRAGDKVWAQRWENRPFTKQQGFDIYGRMYTLKEVHRDFVFRARMPNYWTSGLKWPGDAHAGHPLIQDRDGKRDLPVSSDPLISFLRTTISGENWNSEEIIIRADRSDASLGHLELLRGDLADHGAFELLKGVKEFLEAGVNLALDIAEFIPGIGQGIMVGRLVLIALDFVTDPMVQELAGMVAGGGIGGIKNVVADFAKVLEPAGLIKWLFFSSGRGIEFPLSYKPRAVAPSPPGKKQGLWHDVATILKNLFEFGVRLLEAVKQLRKRAQIPMRAARVRVLSHPLVAELIELVVGGLDALAELGVAGVKDGANHLVVQASAAMGGLSGIQLPESLVPLEVIFDFIADLLIEALPAKYELIAGGVKAILVKAGVWGRFTSAIGGLFKKNDLDPNQLYQEYVGKPLGDHLMSIRNTLVGAVRELFDGFGFQPSDPAPQGISVDFSGTEFAEAEAFGAGTRAVDPSGAALPRPSGGKPMSEPMRATAESRLGQDLGHVRVHGGSEGGKVAGSFGAEAVTSGSHVYMQPDVARSGRGAEIFGHELGHVVGQTGPRPLGGNAPSTPVAGRPERGLVLDRSREAAADRVGARMVHGGPVAGAEAPHGAAGWQPSLARETLDAFLEDLGDIGAVREAATATEADLKRRARKVNLSPANTKIAKAVAAALRAEFKSASLLFQKPFGAFETEIKGFLAAESRKLDDLIPVLAVVAELRKMPKGRGKADAVKVLDRRGLRTEIETHFLGATGIALEVELLPDGGEEPNGKVKSVKVQYLHLPNLPATPDGEKIWTAVLTRTFGKKLKDPDLYRRAAYLVLSKKGLKSGNWKVAEPVLSSDVKESIETQVTALTSLDKGKLSVWPTPAEYVQIDAGQIPTKRKEVKWNGLRVATYGEILKPAGGEKSDLERHDREIHHTPQYLLFEYLRNIHHNRKPFGDGAELYPGVAVNARGRVETISRDETGGPKIEVGKFEAGTRGDALPGTSLSRHTHQSPIHYKSEPQDEKKTGRATMGNTVENVFKKTTGIFQKLVGRKKVAGKLEAGLKKLAKATDREPMNIDGVDVTRKGMREKIYSAARACYRDMWKDMSDKLDTHMVAREVDFYDTVAEQRGIKDRLDRKKVSDVLKATRAKTETLMGSGGAGLA